MKPRTLARLLAFALAVAAGFAMFKLERSPTQPDEWNLAVMLDTWSVGLLVLAVLVLWLAPRFLARKDGPR